jgi:alpha-L-rhamnosidase
MENWMSVRLTRRGLIAGTSLAGCAIATPPLAAVLSEGFRVLRPQANTLDNPMGVHDQAVRLSWQLQSEARNTKQVAYQIEVASSEEALKAGNFDLWDSGRIQGDEAFDVAYRGKTLGSRQTAWWQVTTWDNFGRTAKSPAVFWEMGLLQATDWKGSWLAAEDGEMRGDREAGLYWVAGSRPEGGAKTRQFRLVFELTEAADLALMTVANTNYKIWLDGTEVEKPAHSQFSFGSQGVVTCPARLRAGKHVLALSLDDLTGFGAIAGGELRCGLLVRAKYKDGRVVRFSSKGTKTATDMPQNWASQTFADKTWPVAALSQTQSMPFPGKGAFLMRRDFAAEASVARARLYVTALGGHETFINGKRVGDDILAAESTDFRKRILYRVHDVTALVKAGDNAIGAMVGDGWYGSYLAPTGRFAFGPAPLRYIAQLEIVYADGRAQTVVTDEAWSLSASPVTMSEIYDGEDYDARLEQSGWASSGFKGDGRWSKVVPAAQPPGQLVGQITPPIRRTRELEPLSIKPSGENYVIDYGQNFAGWTRLKVRGTAGDVVILRFGELLNPDGTVDQSNLRAARAADIYTLKGDPNGETYEPRFTYHGFRYVEISGLRAPPTKADVGGIVIGSDLPETGHLRIGNTLISQLWQNTLWSQRSNFVGIPTDCPQRDERLGWMGDAHVFWDAASFNMNVASFTERWMADVRDAQVSNGAFSNVSPNTMEMVNDMGASPGWSDAGVILPWVTWKRFGDTAVIDQNWDAMVRYLDFIKANSEDFIWTKKRGMDFGDWLSLDSKFPGDATTPKELIGTAMWKHSTDALVEMARVTNRDEAVARYTELSEKIKAAFTKAFVKPDGTVSNDSQTGYILALRFDLLPSDLRQAAAAKLKDNIVGRGNLLTTGFLGTPNSLDVLSDFGYAQTVYDLLLRTAYPSWGYMVSKGATTIWERWNGDTGDLSMNSFNHYSLGAVTGFVYRRIAGLDPTEPGFRHFTFNPVLDARVKTGGADLDAMPGRISTDWVQEPNGRFSLSLTVPANARARVHLPATKPASVRESGKPLSSIAGIKIEGVRDNRLVIEIGSGVYRFTT